MEEEKIIPKKGTAKYNVWLEEKAKQKCVDVALQFGEEMTRLLQERKPRPRYSMSNGECYNREQIERWIQNRRTLEIKTQVVKSDPTLFTSKDLNDYCLMLRRQYESNLKYSSRLGRRPKKTLILTESRSSF
ncbi:hypothetical protein HN832_01470 [archaeon]|jgi:hypothetical protein|nr:hypothetical protein [archaeon]MBT4373947.1 hypothetical protein [archaeon]MBT4532340.1 hypothetical protein [archaeon]MBT7001926.1 hypothetical protein [archaeon]MBT7282061.1 hypothetical protein [archaeon]